MNRYVVEKWEGRRSGVDHALWRKAELRCRGGQAQAGMGSLFCHLRPWWLLPPAVAKAMFGFAALPVTVVGLMFVSCYHQRLCGCLGWEQLPEAMLVSKGHADAVAIPIWMACTIIQGIVISRRELWLRNISGSMVLWHLGFVLMSMGNVTTGGQEWASVGDLDIGELALPLIGCLNRRAAPYPEKLVPTICSWESWPWSLMNLEELGPNLHQLPCLASWSHPLPCVQERVAQTNYTPGPHPQLWVGTPQHLSHLWPAREHEGISPVEP